MNDDDIVKTGIVKTVTDGSACLLLNRPQSMNALTYEMVLEIDRTLCQWSEDENIKYVTIAGAGDRAFCAGGDVLSFYHAIQQKTAAEYAEKFFTAEYNMNQRMKTYPKPLTSLMHGIVMGGGVGASAHAKHRIAFSDLRLALPECSIGLIPDVGSSYILAQAPGAIGKYIGLTGTRLNAADALFCGFADSVIAADKRPTFSPLSTLPPLWQTLSEDPEAIKTMQDPKLQISELPARQSEIDAICASDDIATIMQNMADAGEIYQKPLATMRGNAPLSMRLFLCAYEHAKNCRSLWEALQFEYRITYHLAQSPEFYEGIRAQLVDKDRNPRWHYKPEDITADVIAQFTGEAILRKL